MISDYLARKATSNRRLVRLVAATLPSCPAISLIHTAEDSTAGRLIAVRQAAPEQLVEQLD